MPRGMSDLSPGPGKKEPTDLLEMDHPRYKKGHSSRGKRSLNRRVAFSRKETKVPWGAGTQDVNRDQKSGQKIPEPSRRKRRRGNEPLAEVRTGGTRVVEP